MTRSLAQALFAYLFAIFIAGCAFPERPRGENHVNALMWHGRLAIQVASDPEQAQSSSFSAAFELEGNAQAGELTLLTPLGAMAAKMTWTANSAILQANGQIQHFESLAALIEHATGTALPVAALFSWLAGENQPADGWHADLSQRAQGRITASRTSPGPAAELRLVLED